MFFILHISRDSHHPHSPGPLGGVGAVLRSGRRHFLLTPKAPRPTRPTTLSSSALSSCPCHLPPFALLHAPPSAHTRKTRGRPAARGCGASAGSTIAEAPQAWRQRQAKSARKMKSFLHKCLKRLGTPFCARRPRAAPPRRHTLHDPLRGPATRPHSARTIHLV